VILERAESRVPMLFDGVRSLEEVARVADAPEATVLRIAFALFCFGALRPVEGNTTVRMGARAGLRDLDIDRERIQARYALAMESDYFKMLGLDRFADSSEVRRAYARLRREMAPETLGPEIWHELRTPIETIREVLDEALRILCTPMLRSAYEFNLAHGPDADRDTDAKVATPSPSLLSKG